MPQLRVKNGPAQGKTYELANDLVQLGRESEVQVLDTAASRQHAEVFAIGDMFFLRDLGSRNGTYLNEERLVKEDQALLRVGDLIRIGATQIVFEEPPPKREELPQFTTGEEDINATVELHLDAAQAAAEPKTAEASLHFSVLYDMAKAISSAFDVQGLLQKVCEIALAATGADGVYAFLREEGKMLPVAHRRRADRHGGETQISSSIVRRSLQHNRAVLVSDALSDKRFSGSSSVILRGIRSVICAPLLAHDRIGGVLYLHSSAIDRTFDDDHLRLVTAIALQAAVALEAMRAREEGRRQLTAVFRTLMAAREQASPAADKGHSERVAACAEGICKALDLPAAESHTIALAALVHDVGKLGAPEGVSERAETRDAYATLGAQMLRPIAGFEDIAAAVEAHLERLDGTGGPRQLIGHQIPRSARILAVACEFDRRRAAAERAGAKPGDAIKQALMGLNQEIDLKFDAHAFNALVLALRSGSLKLA